MKVIILCLTLGLAFNACLYAQEDPEDMSVPNPLPYYEIPEAPAEYTAETVVARMMDGLGFRYYWATEGLRAEDLSFKPNETARTSEETIDHILGLTHTILNTVKQVPNVRGGGSERPVTFEGKRERTLKNIQQASEILKSGEVSLEDCKIIFQRGENRSEFPFWNNLNGPIADAIWHVGQVVSMRRSSGNPFNSKASVFSGKLRE